MNRRRMTQHVPVPEFPDQPALVESAAALAQAKNVPTFRQEKRQPRVFVVKTGRPGFGAEHFAIGGIGLGTAFPVATISIQNAVEPHQLGTATASFNFFRSLGSAIFVAAFGAIFIGGLGIGGQAIGSLDALVAAAAHQGTAIGSVFRYVFGAAAVTLAVGFLCIAAMKELPLRAR